MNDLNLLDKRIQNEIETFFSNFYNMGHKISMKDLFKYITSNLPILVS